LPNGLAIRAYPKDEWNFGRIWDKHLRDRDRRKTKVAGSMERYLWCRDTQLLGSLQIVQLQHLSMVPESRDSGGSDHEEGAPDADYHHAGHALGSARHPLASSLTPPSPILQQATAHPDYGGHFLISSPSLKGEKRTRGRLGSQAEAGLRWAAIRAGAPGIVASTPLAFNSFLVFLNL
jgi:hypothetical protein